MGIWWGFKYKQIRITWIKVPLKYICGLILAGFAIPEMPRTEFKSLWQHSSTTELPVSCPNYLQPYIPHRRSSPAVTGLSPINLSRCHEKAHEACVFTCSFAFQNLFGIVSKVSDQKLWKSRHWNVVPKASAVCPGFITADRILVFLEDSMTMTKCRASSRTWACVSCSGSSSRWPCHKGHIWLRRSHHECCGQKRTRWPLGSGVSSCAAEARARHPVSMEEISIPIHSPFR